MSKQVYSRSVCGYGVENRKRRLWKAKERNEDLKDKDYRTINGLIPGPEAIISVFISV